MNSSYESNKVVIETLNFFIGKTVKSIDYTGEYSAGMCINFTDNTFIDIDTVGDDMAHMIIITN